MIDGIEHFHFLRPGWLLLGPALWLCEYLLRSDRDDLDPFNGVIAPHLLAHLRLQRHTRRWFTPGRLLGALFLIAVVIAAGPSWRQQPSPLAEDAAPLVLVLDLSESMDTADVAPTRLERAKQKITDLLAAVPDKQAALVVFAGSAHTALPLSPDHDILASYLASLNTGMMPRAGKFPEYALASIDRVLRDSVRGAGIVLLTDGLGSDTTAAFADWFSRRPHQLLVWGFGSPDPKQSDVPLARSALENLAAATGGDYVDASIDTRDVDTLTRLLRGYYVVVDNEALPWLDAGYALVFPALALALMWFRRGWTRAWAVVLLAVVVGLPEPASAEDTAPQPNPSDTAGLLERGGDAFLKLWLTPDQYGRVLLQFGWYDKAARTFTDPIWQATARYYNQEFAEAASLFTRRDSDAALFNEANARAHRRDYLRAVRRYDALLARNPDYPGAGANRDRIQALIDAINQLSESQQSEDGVGVSELDPDADPIPADGAEELAWDQQDRLQLSAEEILASPEAAEMWMKGVQQDPSRFLGTKFGIQLKERGVREP